MAEFCKCGARRDPDMVTCGTLDCMVEYAEEHPPTRSADYTRGRRDGMRELLERLNEPGAVMSCLELLRESAAYLEHGGYSACPKGLRRLEVVLTAANEEAEKR